MQSQIRLPPLAALLLLTLITTLANGLSDVPAGAEVHEDNGQVTINDDPTANNSVPDIPIRATIFSGTPGPYNCRGGAFLKLDIPPPPIDGATGATVKTAALCYNMATPAGCGNFVANKEDGCEVHLFAERNCRLYMNTAVFIPEDRAVGGLWRSMSIQCGIPPPPPEVLGAPPLQGLLAGAKMKPKEGGKV